MAETIEFGPRIVYEMAGNPKIFISETVIITWLIMALLVIGSIILTRNFEKIPRGKQNAIEAIVGTINNLVIDTMGEENKKFAPYMGTLLLFILFGNLIGLVGLRPATADLNTTLALAMLTFVITHYVSIKGNGIGGYIKGYFEPFAFILPMNIFGNLAQPISLSFRLFGNIAGGLIVMTLVYNALAAFSAALGMTTIPILQAIVPVALHLYFDLFSGALQSFIFVMLTMVFIVMG